MADIVERLAGWENKGHEGDPIVDMLLDDTALALAEIRRLQSENQVLRTFAHEATKALSELASGGSECFGKEVGGIFLADVPFCLSRAQEKHRRLQERLRAGLSAERARTLAAAHPSSSHSAETGGTT